MSEKVDLRRTLDGYQAEQGQFRVIDVPELTYLMVDGHGDPNSAVVTLLESVCRGPAVLLGHSLGGRLGLLVASRRPDLVDGWCWRIRRWPACRRPRNRSCPGSTPSWTPPPTGSRGGLAHAPGDLVVRR